MGLGTSGPDKSDLPDSGRDEDAAPTDAAVHGLDSGVCPSPDGGGDAADAMPTCGAHACASDAWLKSAGGSGYDRAEGIAATGDGYSYVTGHFSGTASFDAASLTSLGGSDAFLIKYGPDGSVQWARRAGGGDDDESHSVAVLDDGSAYVTGHFLGRAEFGDTTLTAASERAALFVVKYGDAGAVEWASTPGGTCLSLGSSVASLPDGSAYVTGTFTGTCSFQSAGGPEGLSISSVDESDVFIAKYLPDGTPAWVRRAGGSGTAWSAAVAALPDGTAYVTGHFYGGAAFGTTSLVATGGYDLFITRYDADGEVVWARQAGGFGDSTYVHGDAVATASDGSVYVTGRFGGAVAFGATAISGSEPMFLAKYDRDGSNQWVSSVDTQRFGSGLAVGVLPTGDALVAGGLLAAGDFSMFLAGFDHAGSLRWIDEASTVGTPFPFSWGRSIAIQSSCSAYLTGGSTQTFTFRESTFTSLGDEDALVLRFNPTNRF